MLMSVSPAELEPPRTTWQEWLDLEDAREDRHELIDGRLVLDQGGTDRHDTVVTSLYNRLFEPFQQQRCRVYPHNRRVVTRTGDGYHPDLVIRCAGRTDQRYEAGPTWIVEVLSPTSTPAQTQAELRGYTSPSLVDFAEVFAEVDELERYGD